MLTIKVFGLQSWISRSEDRLRSDPTDGLVAKIPPVERHVTGAFFRREICLQRRAGCNDALWLGTLLDTKRLSLCNVRTRRRRHIPGRIGYTADRVGRVGVAERIERRAYFCPMLSCLSRQAGCVRDRTCSRAGSDAS